MEQMNEERARNLAYLESEAEMGRFMVSGTPSAEAVARQEKGVLGQIKLAFQGLADAFLGYRYAQPHEAIDDFAKTLFNYPVRALARVAEEARRMGQMRYSTKIDASKMTVGQKYSENGKEYVWVGKETLRLIDKYIVENIESLAAEAGIPYPRRGLALVDGWLYLYEINNDGYLRVEKKMLNFGRNGKLFDKWRNLYVQRIRSIIAARRNNDGNGRVFGGSWDGGVHNDGVADRAAAKFNGVLDPMAQRDIRDVSTGRGISGRIGRNAETLSNAKRLSIAIDTMPREYDEVVARYKGTDQWLKVPNGRMAHLSSEIP